MAKITVIGDAMVITSSKRFEDIMLLEKYRPKALALYSEDGKDEIFRVGTTNNAGSINTYGASFGSVSHDGQELATITLGIPSGIDSTEVEDYVEDVVGTAILNLNKVEEQIDDAIEEVWAERAEIRQNITIE